MAQQRFNKTAMLEFLAERVAHYEKTFGFTSKNGSAQVRGRSNEVCIAYGEYSLCADIIEDIESGYIRS